MSDTASAAALGAAAVVAGDGRAGLAVHAVALIAAAYGDKVTGLAGSPM
ncbi:hypothetical protein [Streptomyces lunaelactis]|nr:hypothetical protein [Streptomyces lunaelactis]